MTMAGDSGLLMEGSCLPCTPDEEKKMIEQLDRESSSMNEGDTFYLLSNKWMMEWRKYVGADDFVMDEEIRDCFGFSNGQVSTSQPSSRPRPGPIDNHHLVIAGEGEDAELVKNLQEDEDYVLVSEHVWKKLHDWYKGGPAVPRKVISQGTLFHNYVAEVYPLRLQLIDGRDNNKDHVIRISKKASLSELYHQVGVLLGLEVEKICIWDYFDKNQRSKLEASDRTLEELEPNLESDQYLLVEEISGTWHSGSGMDSTGNGMALVSVEPSRSPLSIAGGPTLSNGHSTGYYSAGYTTDFYGGHYGGKGLVSSYDSQEGFNSGKMTKRNRGGSAGLRNLGNSSDNEEGFNLGKMTKGDRGGLAGLQNLGNTCFMNSALQCLVHTPPLVDYFLQDYSEEINKQNPIGMQGELAIAFGDLLRTLWSPGRAPVAPRIFKTKLARFAPQFSGYNQHDSHELLAFLLDGLHEDLNRVKLKPYKELKDANGRPDEDVANESWEIHKARNDSVIVDVCQGQYKSTLVCPDCNKVSVTFDPFMYLTLPLPSRVTRSMTITVFYGDGSALPMPYTVTVLKHGFVKDLVQTLSTACCLRSDECLLLAEVYEHAIFKYLDSPFDPLSQIRDDEYIVAYRLPKNLEEYTKLEIINRVQEKKLIGTPLITCLAKGPQNSTDLQNAVNLVLNPLLKMKNGHPSNWIHNVKEDSTLGLDDVKIETGDFDHDIGEQSMDKMEVDQEPNSKFSFNLSLVSDEKSLECSPIESDFHFQPDSDVKVCLDWSDREFDIYDRSYLQDLPVVHKTGYSVKKTRQEAITLFACLEAFLKDEPLGPDDMWYCPTCKEHRQATKKLDLWRLPEILVVHLKRFSYSRWFKNKLDTFVDFPIRNLNLKEYVMNKDSASQSDMYELYAVSNHYGGLGGGHYTANAKVDENKWYHFDDSHVSPIGEDEIKAAAAYVLFYRRVPVEPPESPQPQPSSG